MSRNVVAPVGNSYSNTDFSISYTIGQLSYNTLAATNGNTATQGFQQPDGCNIMIKAFLEGFYMGNGYMRPGLLNAQNSLDSTESDSIQINLWNASTTSTSINPNFSEKTILHTNGIANVFFPETAVGQNHYISIRHRNSLETWSSIPKSISFNNSYDFSSNISSAFGDGVNPPLKNLGDGKYALYGGDVNQDGTTDLIDMQLIENDAAAFQFGYFNTDCNGDGSSDLSDMLINENNASLFLFYARPY